VTRRPGEAYAPPTDRERLSGLKPEVDGRLNVVGIDHDLATDATDLADRGDGSDRETRGGRVQ